MPHNQKTASPEKNPERTKKWDAFAAEAEQEAAELTLPDEQPEVEVSPAPEGIDYLSADELRTQLLAAETKAMENWEKVLRIQAEKENLQRRAKLDMEAERKFGSQKILQELLPVLDNLERSLESCAAQDALREGIELTLKSLRDAVSKFGVKEVDALGKLFDPHLHEAVSTQEQADTPAGTILMVLQKGYLLHERLIRSAMVVIAK